ncbi:MAG: hypothetical protein J3Q66DRAFT_394170 [Benniella sp.]|nr:MAG: hypothetical protein J3Q66DRAFT_394170 [Benniella sp.]
MTELSRALEEAIETIVSRAIAKAMVSNHRNYWNALSRFNTDSKSCSHVIVQGIRTMGLDKHVPTEVWERIFKYLYPSQLSRVSMVCQTFYYIVVKLPVWPEIYAQVHLNDQNHLAGVIKPVLGKNPNKDFMLRLCAESLRICELCLSVYNGTDIPKDRLASLPLPVHVWRVRAFMKKATFQPLPSKRSPTDWMIRLCVSCRRQVLVQCPESIPKDPKITLPMFYQYNQYQGGLVMGFGHEKARQTYGGDIGVASAGQNSSSKAIETMEARLEDDSLRLAMSMMNC